MSTDTALAPTGPQSTAMQIVPPNLTTQMQTVVPLDRENLTFFAKLVQSCGLIPKQNGVSEEMMFNRAMGKIVAGTSYGFDPFLSQECFNAGLFGGMPLNAQGLGILFRRSGEYDLHIVEHTNKGCTANIMRRYNGVWTPEIKQFTGGEWKQIGVVTFNETMAKAAGLSNKDMYQKYGEDMYYARVVTRAVKRYNPSCRLPIVVLGNHFARESQPTFGAPPAPPAAPVQITEAAASGETPPQSNEPEGVPYTDPVYNEGDATAITVEAEDQEIEGEVVEFAGPQEEAKEAEPIDPEESKYQNLLITAKELYTELKGPEKKKADAFIGSGNLLKDLDAERLAEFLDTFTS